MNARENPPFDPLAKTAKEDAKTFDDAIFRFMSLEDRKRWMGSGLFNDLRVFQTGYYEKARGHAGERESLSEGILIYCIAGKGRFVQKSTTWRITDMRPTKRTPGRSIGCTFQDPEWRCTVS